MHTGSSASDERINILAVDESQVDEEHFSSNIQECCIL